MKIEAKNSKETTMTIKEAMAHIEAGRVLMDKDLIEKFLAPMVAVEKPLSKLITNDDGESSSHKQNRLDSIAGQEFWMIVIILFSFIAITAWSYGILEKFSFIRDADWGVQVALIWATATVFTITSVAFLAACVMLFKILRAED